MVSSEFQIRVGSQVKNLKKLSSKPEKLNGKLYKI